MAQDVLAVSKVEPAELKKEGTKHQKENIGKMAEYLRTHLVSAQAIPSTI